MGRIIVIEFTSEKVEMLKKTFPFAEAVLLSIEEVEDYVSGNRFLIDVLVSATDSDALNLRYAKHAIKSGVPIVIAILNNPLNEPIFVKEEREVRDKPLQDHNIQDKRGCGEVQGQRGVRVL
jgi:hypothetical protein